MAKRRIALLAALLYLLTAAVFAASTADAKEPIATQNDCVLTITYRCDGAAFSGRDVQLYHIADVSADFQYTLAPSFAPSGLILNGIQTQGEWNVIRSTLEAYILAGSVEPVATAITDDTGNACFQALKPGLYLASALHGALDDRIFSFDAALVALPGLGEDGCWQYSVTVAAKPAILPPVDPGQQIELGVVKLWKGDENHNSRPERVQVEIFKDGVSYATKVLSEENHWACSWTAQDDGAQWQVVERDVPSGYTMTVEQRENTFVLTNTFTPDEPEDPDLPPTGDTSHVLLYAILIFVSGTVLILLGIGGKRKRHEETN